MPEPTATQVNIDSTLDEQRLFDPPAEFSQKAQIKSLAEYEALYKESVEEPEKFWARAAEELHWFQEVGQGSGVESAMGQLVCRRRDQSSFFSGSPRLCSQRPSPKATRQTGAVRASVAESFPPVPETCVGTDQPVCHQLRRL